MVNNDINRFIFEFVDDGLRGHDKNVQKRFRLDVRKFVFSNRVINNRNSLPAHCTV